jgi:hypothetical protein
MFPLRRGFRPLSKDPIFAPNSWQEESMLLGDEEASVVVVVVVVVLSLHTSKRQLLF